MSKSDKCTASCNPQTKKDRLPEFTSGLSQSPYLSDTTSEQIIIPTSGKMGIDTTEKTLIKSEIAFPIFKPIGGESIQKYHERYQKDTEEHSSSPPDKYDYQNIIVGGLPLQKPTTSEVFSTGQLDGISKLGTVSDQFPIHAKLDAKPKTTKSYIAKEPIVIEEKMATSIIVPSVLGTLQKPGTYTGFPRDQLDDVSKPVAVSNILPIHDKLADEIKHTVSEPEHTFGLSQSPYLYDTTSLQRIIPKREKISIYTSEEKPIKPFAVSDNLPIHDKLADTIKNTESGKAKLNVPKRTSKEGHVSSSGNKYDKQKFIASSLPRYSQKSITSKGFLKDQLDDVNKLVPVSDQLPIHDKSKAAESDIPKVKTLVVKEDKITTGGGPTSLRDKYDQQNVIVRDLLVTTQKAEDSGGFPSVDVSKKTSVYGQLPIHEKFADKPERIESDTTKLIPPITDKDSKMIRRTSVEGRPSSLRHMYKEQNIIARSSPGTIPKPITPKDILKDQIEHEIKPVFDSHQLQIQDKLPEKIKTAESNIAKLKAPVVKENKMTTEGASTSLRHKYDQQVVSGLPGTIEKNTSQGFPKADVSKPVAIHDKLPIHDKFADKAKRQESEVSKLKPPIVKDEYDEHKIIDPGTIKNLKTSESALKHQLDDLSRIVPSQIQKHDKLGGKPKYTSKSKELIVTDAKTIKATTSNGRPSLTLGKYDQQNIMIASGLPATIQTTETSKSFRTDQLEDPSKATAANDQLPIHEKFAGKPKGSESDIPKLKVPIIKDDKIIRPTTSVDIDSRNARDRYDQQNITSPIASDKLPIHKLAGKTNRTESDTEKLKDEMKKPSTTGGSPTSKRDKYDKQKITVSVLPTIIENPRTLDGSLREQNKTKSTESETTHYKVPITKSTPTDKYDKQSVIDGFPKTSEESVATDSDHLPIQDKLVNMPKDIDTDLTQLKVTLVVKGEFVKSVPTDDSPTSVTGGGLSTPCQKPIARLKMPKIVGEDKIIKPALVVNKTLSFPRDTYDKQKIIARALPGTSQRSRASEDFLNELLLSSEPKQHSDSAFLDKDNSSDEKVKETSIEKSTVPSHYRDATTQIGPQSKSKIISLVYGDTDDVESMGESRTKKHYPKPKSKTKNQPKPTTEKPVKPKVKTSIDYHPFIPADFKDAKDISPESYLYYSSSELSTVQGSQVAEVVEPSTQPIQFIIPSAISGTQKVIEPGKSDTKPKVSPFSSSASDSLRFANSPVRSILRNTDPLSSSSQQKKSESALASSVSGPNKFSTKPKEVTLRPHTSSSQEIKISSTLPGLKETTSLIKGSLDKNMNENTQHTPTSGPNSTKPRRRPFPPLKPILRDEDSKKTSPKIMPHLTVFHQTLDYSSDNEPSGPHYVKLSLFDDEDTLPRHIHLNEEENKLPSDDFVIEIEERETSDINSAPERLYRHLTEEDSVEIGSIQLDAHTSHSSLPSFGLSKELISLSINSYTEYAKKVSISGREPSIHSQTQTEEEESELVRKSTLEFTPRRPPEDYFYYSALHLPPR